MEAGRRSRWLSMARVVVVVLVIFIGGVVAAYQSTDIPNAASEYEQHRQAAVTAGLLFTQDQVRNLYSIPANQNGASLLLTAKIPGPGTLTVVEPPTMAERLRALEPQLKTLEIAIRKEHILFDHDKDDALFIGSSTSNLRGWIQCLIEYSTNAIRQDDLATSQRLLTIASSLARHADEDKTRLALLTRANVCQTLEGQARLILELHGRDSKWRTLAQSMVEMFDRPYDVKSAINLEHYSNVEFIRELEADPMTFRQAYDSREYPMPVRYSKFLPKFYKAVLSRIHARYVATYTKLPMDPFDLAGAQRACALGDDYLSRDGWSYSGLKTYDEDFGQFVGALQKEAAMRNAVFTAIRILDGVKSARPNDRHSLDIDGQPIRTTANTVYSIWQDGSDDGGKPIVDGHGDWVIRLPN